MYKRPEIPGMEGFVLTGSWGDLVISCCWAIAAYPVAAIAALCFISRPSVECAWLCVFAICLSYQWSRYTSLRYSIRRCREFAKSRVSDLPAVKEMNRLGSGMLYGFIDGEYLMLFLKVKEHIDEKVVPSAIAVAKSNPNLAPLMPRLADSLLPKPAVVLFEAPDCPAVQFPLTFHIPFERGVRAVVLLPAFSHFRVNIFYDFSVLHEMFHVCEPSVRLHTHRCLLSFQWLVAMLCLPLLVTNGLAVAVFAGFCVAYFLVALFWFSPLFADEVMADYNAFVCLDTVQELTGTPTSDELVSLASTFITIWSDEVTFEETTRRRRAELRVRIRNLQSIRKELVADRRPFYRIYSSSPAMIPLLVMVILQFALGMFVIQEATYGAEGFYRNDRLGYEWATRVIFYPAFVLLFYNRYVLARLLRKEAPIKYEHINGMWL